MAISKYSQASPSVSLGNNYCGSLELFGNKMDLNESGREEKIILKKLWKDSGRSYWPV